MDTHSQIIRISFATYANKMRTKCESHKLLYCIYPLDYATKRLVSEDSRSIRGNEVGSLRKMTLPHPVKRLSPFRKMSLVIAKNELGHFEKRVKSFFKMSQVIPGKERKVTK